MSKVGFGGCGGGREETKEPTGSGISSSSKQSVSDVGQVTTSIFCCNCSDDDVINKALLLLEEKEERE